MIKVRLKCEKARLALFLASLRHLHFFNCETETSKCFECELETFRFRHYLNFHVIYTCKQISTSRLS